MDIEEKLKTMKTSQGVSLYDHLLNTLGRLAETHPRNPLGSFEEHSQFVRDTGYHYADGRNYRDADGRMYKGQEEYLNKTAKYSWSTFLPVALFYHFSKFTNIYFLLVMGV